MSYYFNYPTIRQHSRKQWRIFDFTKIGSCGKFLKYDYLFLVNTVAKKNRYRYRLFFQFLVIIDTAFIADKKRKYMY